MAKVDTVRFQFQGEWKILEVHFTKKDQFYIKDCPGEIVEFGEYDNRQVTLMACTEKFKSAIIRTEAKLQSVRKVILVKFLIASKMISTPNPFDSGSSIDCKNPLYKFCPSSMIEEIDGYGFAIDYRVVLEVTQGKEKLYYRLNTADTTYRRGSIGVGKNETPIAYSEEAIKSLEHIKASLKDMVTSISNFFTDADKLELSLESGNLKMLVQ